METKEPASRRIGVFALPVIAVIALLALGALPAGTGGRSSESLRYNNWIDIDLGHPSCLDFPDNPNCGAPPEHQRVHNTVTNLGKNYTRDFLSGISQYNSSITNWTIIELSTDNNIGAGNTTCNAAVTGNGLDIAQATSINRQGTGNYSASKVFSVSGSQTGIVRVCLSWNATTGNSNLTATAAISSTNVANGDTLNITYSVAAE